MRGAVGQAFDLTTDEIWLLKALLAAGERGRTVSALPSRVGLARLVEVQYITKQPEAGRKTTGSAGAGERAPPGKERRQTPQTGHCAPSFEKQHRQTETHSIQLMA